MTVRARAILLVGVALIAFVGVAVANVLYVDRVDRRTREDIRQVQLQQDGDMCDMLTALLPTPRPTVVTSGRVAVERYQARRCSTAAPMPRRS